VELCNEAGEKGGAVEVGKDIDYSKFDTIEMDSDEEFEREEAANQGPTELDAILDKVSSFLQAVPPQAAYRAKVLEMYQATIAWKKQYRSPEDIKKKVSEVDDFMERHAGFASAVASLPAELKEYMARQVAQLGEELGKSGKATGKASGVGFLLTVDKATGKASGKCLGQVPFCTE